MGPGPRALPCWEEQIFKKPTPKKVTKFGILDDFMKTKKMREVRTIILAAVSRRDLCYASENEGFRFLVNLPPVVPIIK